MLQNKEKATENKENATKQGKGYLRFETSPNLEGQVPVCISPRNRVALLYPQAPGSLFVASYGSQGYGGGIKPASTRVEPSSKSKLCYDRRSVGQSVFVRGSEQNVIISSKNLAYIFQTDRKCT
jgi:hypothetical protein